MSGGHWNYENDRVCDDIFGIYPDYGKSGFNCSGEARRRDPLEDPELSELVYDVFCLLHSADWYFSSDTGEDTYREDVKYFKNKWFKSDLNERVNREIESALEKAREDLGKVFGEKISNSGDVKRIKIKYFDQDIEKIQKVAVGDWIDLRSAWTMELKAGEYVLIPLGVGMILPDGYEAHILPRSSTPDKFGIILANSMGVIDNSYSGDSDEWHFPAVAIRDTTIFKGDRIAQFRIVKNQPEIKFEVVGHLNEISRGGIGSTGRR